MKNKTLLSLVLLIFLSAAGYYLVQQDKSSDKINDILMERDFLVESKTDIKGLIISPQISTSYRLDKVKADWYLNRNIKANSYVVDGILQIFTDIELDHIPTKKATGHLLKAIDKSGIKVELLGSNEKVFKTVWIGSDASFGKGTNMMMYGSQQPYVMALPMITGGFRPRFTYEFDQLRDPKIIAYDAEDIMKVSIVYPKDQSASFKITNDNGNYAVDIATDYQQASSLATNADKVRAYMEGFGSMSIEGWDNSNEKKDSINELIPFADISFELTDGKRKQFRLYPFNDFLDPKVHIDEWEQSKRITRYFITTEDGLFGVGQQRVLGKMLRPYYYFFED